MSDETLYRLGDSTVAEPLVNRWVAWSHVVAPAAASLHLRQYQLGLLQSYLENPRAHEQACREPKLRSGRFVEIPEARAREVEEFLAATERRQRANLRFADALLGFHNMLVEEARGMSLEPFYARLPEELRGYVELVYDYYDRPIVRVIESLLYESPLYDKHLQSFRLFAQERDDSRSFFMNTPRLPGSEAVEWGAAFDDPAVDDLFRLDTEPRPLGHIRELLGLGPADEPLVRRLLSGAAAPPPGRWTGSTPRVRYFGHACVLVEWNGTNLLTDPCLGVTPSAGGAERYGFRDLPEKIDYVVVTHNHHDHLALETLLRLRHRVGCLVVPRAAGVFYGDLSLRLLAKKIGFKNVVDLETLDEIELPGGSITSIPFMGEHADLPHGKTAYVVRAGGERILFGADSDCLDRRVYDHVRRILGPVQTVFLGMECVGAPLTWSGAPFLPRRPAAKVNSSRRYKGCDSIRAETILDALGARRMYVYAMGIEPWYEHLLGLAYSEDSAQLREARKLLADSRGEGRVRAEMLVGRGEFLIEGGEAAPVSAARGGPGVFEFEEERVSEEESQFSFD